MGDITMNVSSQKWRRSIQVVLALLAILVAITAAPGRLLAIDGQRLKAADQNRFAPRDQPPGERERQPGARERDGQRLIHPGPHARWTLGVRVDNLSTGTRITDVMPSSAAWRVGLERKDIIVSVDGYQVGYVGRRLYDLQAELNLRADRDGRVRLLVWNHRDGELVNVDVALDRGHPKPPGPIPKKGGIRGTVSFQSSIAANQKAEILVQLVDITDRLRGGKMVVEDRIPFTGRVPVPFHLDIDPARLESHRRFQLQAQLSVDGKRMLASQPGLYLLNQVDVRAVKIELKPIRFDRR